MGQGTKPREQPVVSRAPRGEVHVLAWRGSDEELLAQLRAGGPEAMAHLYDRFSTDVNRMVWRLLGADPDHDDLVQQVFVHLLHGIKRVRSSESLRGWVLSVTVNTVRSELRKRTVRRRFRRHHVDAYRFDGFCDDNEARALLGRTFQVLDKMPAGERLAFALRYVDGQTLADTAALCGCSLATIKRRLKRAEKRFVALAEKDAELAARLRHSPRWGDK